MVAALNRPVDYIRGTGNFARTLNATIFIRVRMVEPIHCKQRSVRVTFLERLSEATPAYNVVGGFRAALSNGRRGLTQN
jgi:hypothetical protein